MSSSKPSMTSSMILPSSCIPGTRITVINKIIQWLTDEARTCNVLWLYGSMGMGKTAVMMSAKEETQKLELPFVGFLTDLVTSEWDRDPRCTVFRIAKSLADTNPEYKLLFEQICESRLLIYGQLEDIFNILFSPLSELEHPRQTLILLDGLDLNHVPLVRLILAVKLPVLWLISSQPFPQFVQMFDRGTGGCMTLNIQCGGDTEAEKDIKIILEHGLRQYGEDLVDHKNTRSAIKTLCEGSSQCPATAIGFLDFIRGAPLLDPRARLLELEMTLTYGGAVFANDNKQIYAMDKAYLRLVRHISGSRESQMHRIVMISAQSSLTPLELSLLLDVPEATVQEIVDQFYAVLATERAGTSNRVPVRLHNYDFYHFLTDPHRSNDYSIFEFQEYQSLAHASLCIIGKSPTRPAELTAKHASLHVAEHYALIHAITHVWEYILKENWSGRWELLRTLNVIRNGLLRLSSRIPVLPFATFLNWLSGRSNLVRSIALCEQDEKLIDACQGIAVPMDFDFDFMQSDSEVGYEGIPNYELVNPFVQDKTPVYALLGRAGEAVLVILAEEGVTIYSMDDIDEL